MLSSIVAVHGDDKGLMFPFKIAPQQVVIVPIKLDKTLLKKCDQIRDGLCDNDIRAFVDASDQTPGWKYNQWEMRGVPIRIELGPKEVREKALTVVRRDDGKVIHHKRWDNNQISKESDSPTLNI